MTTPEALKKSHAFNVQMSPNEMGMLQQLAGERGESKAKVLRDLLDRSWRMRFNNEPHCADCSACKCPTMHSIRPTDPQTTNELFEAQQAQEGRIQTTQTNPDGYMER